MEARSSASYNTAQHSHDLNRSQSPRETSVKQEEASPSQGLLGGQRTDGDMASTAATTEPNGEATSAPTGITIPKGELDIEPAVASTEGSTPKAEQNPADDLDWPRRRDSFSSTEMAERPPSRLGHRYQTTRPNYVSESESPTPEKSPNMILQLMNPPSPLYIDPAKWAEPLKRGPLGHVITMSSPMKVGTPGEPPPDTPFAAIAPTPLDFGNIQTPADGVHPQDVPQLSSTTESASPSTQVARLVPGRRTTRGSLAAAAAAAYGSEESNAAPSPRPGEPVQASVNVWIITEDHEWVLPPPQYGVSLEQVLPADFAALPWMRFTRSPICWDRKTNAGGKSGKNLVTIGAAASKIAVNGKLPPRETSDDSDRSDWTQFPGLHLLTDSQPDERPAYSYALMTRFAILGSPYKSLSLGEIYMMLEAKFPWYARDQNKWRDSIRYNLSSNCWFVKTKRGLHQPGVGNLWMVDESSSGGPKRPRKGRKGGGAPVDNEEDEDDGNDEEPGPSYPTPHHYETRNGTLMCTFDSKTKVPLDPDQGHRQALGQSSHNLLPRVFPRPPNAANAGPSSSASGQQSPGSSLRDLESRRSSRASLTPPITSPAEDEVKTSKFLEAAEAAVRKTRAAAARGETYKQAFQSFHTSPQKTPAPPWMNIGGDGAGDEEEGIGSGRDDDSIDEDDGIPLEVDWSNGNYGAASRRSSDHHFHSQAHPRETSRGVQGANTRQDGRHGIPSSDDAGLRRLSEVALSLGSGDLRGNSTTTVHEPSILIRGQPRSPTIQNGVVLHRRKANVINEDLLFGRPERRSSEGSIVAPSFASLLGAHSGRNSAGTSVASRNAEGSSAGGSKSYQEDNLGRGRADHAGGRQQLRPIAPMPALQASPVIGNSAPLRSVSASYSRGTSDSDYPEIRRSMTPIERSQRGASNVLRCCFSVRSTRWHSETQKHATITKLGENITKLQAAKASKSRAGF